MYNFRAFKNLLGSSIASLRVHSLYVKKRKKPQNPKLPFLSFQEYLVSFLSQWGPIESPEMKIPCPSQFPLNTLFLFDRTWIHLRAPTDCPTDLSWLYLKPVASHFITILTSAPQLQKLKEQLFIISFNSLHFTDKETEVFPHSFPS